MSVESATLDDVLGALRRLEALVLLNGRPRTLLSRGAAAESMGVSLAHFDRYVKPYVPFVQIGTRIMYRPADLERWVSRQVERPDSRDG